MGLTRMNEVVFVLLAVIVGGAVGARLQGFDAWRGAVAAMAGAIFVMVLAFGFAVSNWIVQLLVFVVAVGVIGGAIKLPGRALSSIVLGSVLFGLTTVAIVQSFAP